MSRKLRLLLLDANIVIELHTQGLWSQVIEKCEILLAETVVAESKFYQSGEHLQDINLTPDIQAGRIQQFSVEAKDLDAFRQWFDPTYLGRLDAGEAEALAYLVSRAEDTYRMCSSDGIVFKVLGRLRCGDQGLSLEEILQMIGLGRALPEQYTTGFRIKYTRMGQTDMITDIGLKDKRT